MASKSNSESKNVAAELTAIHDLINQGKHKEALCAFRVLEADFPSNKTIKFNTLGLLVDAGLGLRDKNMIKEGLDAGEKCLFSNRFKGYEAVLHYNLANGYVSLFNLVERKDGLTRIAQSANLQKAKTHYRQAAERVEDLNLDLKKQLWVNYGNCLDALGRGVESFYAYDEALKLDGNFSMAIGNKAFASRRFADISGEYRAAIYVDAYQAIASIIDKEDLIAYGGLRAKQLFEKQLKEIEAQFKDKGILRKKLKHRKYSSTKLSDFEKFYVEFCIREKLFLNFHIHQASCEPAVNDPIFIRLITTAEDRDRFYELAKHINQIKEDYATARLLLLQSRYKRKDFDSISQRTTFVNTLDYSQFNLYYGLLKLSFRASYNILDKIAVFINDYYGLGLKERDIYFARIWTKNNRIRDKILLSRNLSLYALYDIFQDFKLGHYDRIRQIRNALTHRKLVIYDFGAVAEHAGADECSIDYQTMVTETLNLLRLARSAIIYLISFVNIEESRKRRRSKGIVVPLVVDTSQFLEFP